MPIFIDTPDTHRGLVLDLIERARDFLKLKDCNSVRVLLRCDLDPTFGQRDHAHPSPILVRVRISNVQAGSVGSNPFCEFRIASAEAFETAARVSFEQVKESILNFFDTQFNANHWFHILKIDADVIMREPAGALAAMEGNSELGAPTHVLKFVTDHKSLSEV